MNKYVKEFCKRGLMFAWGGPAIVAIVWFCIEKGGALEQLTAGQVLLGVLSSSLLAFIAAGVTIVHQIEKLPRSIATLIQMGVLYVDYLGIYLINGWIKSSAVLVFTLIFVGVFAVIWGTVYCVESAKVKRMNRQLEQAR